MVSAISRKRIPIILPAKVDGIKKSQKLDDIVRDELSTEKVFSNKTVKYPNYRSMISLSVAYGLVNDIFGKKSRQSKEFRESCTTGKNLYIYYSMETDSRYVNRDKFSEFIQYQVLNYRGK